MSFVRWIDVGLTSGEDVYTIEVGTTGELTDAGEFRLNIEEIDENAERFEEVADSEELTSLGGFEHHLEGGKHYYRRFWEPPEVAHNRVIRFAYEEKGDKVVSDETLVLFDGLTVKSRDPLAAKGSAPDLAESAIGASFLSAPFAIRVVRAETSEHKGFGEQFLTFPVPWIANRSAMPDRFVNLVFARREELAGAKKSEWPIVHESLRMKTDADGYLFDPVLAKDASKQHLARIFRVNSRFFQVVQGHFVPQFDFFFALVGTSESEVEARGQELITLFSLLGDKGRTMAKRLGPLIVDNIASRRGIVQYDQKDDGKGHPQRHSHLEIKPDFRVPLLHLPVKWRQHGGFIDLFEHRYTHREEPESQDFLERVITLKGLGGDEEDVLEFNYARLAEGAVNKVAKGLVFHVIDWFRKSDEESLRWLFESTPKLTIGRFMAEVRFALVHAFRERLTGPQPKTKNQVKERWQKLLDRADVAAGVASVAILSGFYEYARRVVGLSIGQNALDAQLSFLERYVGPATAGGSAFPEVLGGVAVKWLMHTQALKDESKKNVRRSFIEMHLVRFGLVGGDADDFLDLLDQRLKAPSLYGAMIERCMRREAAPQEQELLRLLAKAVDETYELVKGVESDFSRKATMDVFHNNSLLADFPTITRVVYDQFNIGLDPTAHPHKPPSSKRDLKNLTWSEFAMIKCGRAFSERGASIKLTLDIFMMVLSGGMTSMFGKAGLAIFESVTGIGNALLSVIEDEVSIVRSYADAVAGLASYEEVRNKRIKQAFNVVFEVFSAGVGRYADRIKRPNPLGWSSADGLFSKALGDQLGDKTSHLVSRGLSRSLRTVLSREARKEVIPIMAFVAKFTADNAPKFFYARALKKAKSDGRLSKQSFKDVMEGLLVEALMRKEIELPPGVEPIDFETLLVKVERLGEILERVEDAR